MVIQRSELKSLAKAQIKGNIATFFGIIVIYSVIFAVAAFIPVAPVVLQGPIYLGAALFMMEVVRTKKGQFNTAFLGFKQFGTSFVASLLMDIFTFLWTLLFIIPGFVACLKYSMTYYIIADNPELSAMEAIKKSKMMMQGHKTELFVLLLSFFWWYVLCFITFGIAGIYVAPYVNATVVNFYEKLKEEENTVILN
ncbi:DUF975 family protein [Treponema pectinovorum]|uniref:DUF975 family protein n=1 Tax=Treponema pectinovorum TaxID=164 RepID=UPI0011CA489F|nr:DUF975 family protein [Treponema pectinovorum]